MKRKAEEEEQKVSEEKRKAEVEKRKAEEEKEAAAKGANEGESTQRSEAGQTSTAEEVRLSKLQILKTALHH